MRTGLPPESDKGRLQAHPACVPLRGMVQAKLAVGAVNDPLEDEADRVAARVLRAPAQAGGEDAQEKPEAGQRSEIANDVLPPTGQPLDQNVRSFFEPRFGYDFSRVRIYADAKAAESAQSLGALAYTTGPNIAFGGGHYQPGTGEGRRLLAHELTHVVQQGHAGAIRDGGGAGIATGRATPAIQRDTPAGQPEQNPQIGPLSITKRIEPDMGVTVPRADVTQALTDFLYQEQGIQGGQTLHVTENVKWAVRKLFQGDPIGSASAEAFLRGITPSTAPDFAAAVTRLLPEFVPQARVSHLGVAPTKTTPDTGAKSVGDAAGHAIVDSTVAPLVRSLKIPKAWQDKIIEGARGAVGDGLVGLVDQAMSGSPASAGDKAAIHSAVEAAIKQKAGTPPDRQESGAGSPYAPVQPPSGAPSGGSPYKAPGEHIFNLPKIPWDFPSPKIPKPNLPQQPLASDADAINKIIQGVDKNALVPAAAKGTPDADKFGDSQEMARALANAIAAADKKKQYTVNFDISTDYRHVEDLPAIFDEFARIIHLIANALPGGAANVGEVIVSPARLSNKDTIPARRIVKLHGGD